MNSKIFIKAVFLIFFTSLSFDANAFWWLFRAAGARATVGAAARTATLGAVEREAAAVGGARICVRPLNAGACDFRFAQSPIDAVARAVGNGYRVRPSQQPNLFEIIDSANNVIDIIQAIHANEEPSISNFPQYQPKFDSSNNYQGVPVAIAPLRHDGAILNLNINYRPTQVWSDGHIEVWADNNPNRVALAPGQRINFPSNSVVHAVPRSQDAYTLFSQAIVATSQPVTRNNRLSSENCPSGLQMINGRWECNDQGRRVDISAENCPSGFRMINGRWTCMD